MFVQAAASTAAKEVTKPLPTCSRRWARSTSIFTMASHTCKREFTFAGNKHDSNNNKKNKKVDEDDDNNDNDN
jgi:hypothetical protein